MSHAKSYERQPPQQRASKYYRDAQIQVYQMRKSTHELSFTVEESCCAVRRHVDRPYTQQFSLGYGNCLYLLCCRGCVADPQSPLFWLEYFQALACSLCGGELVQLWFCWLYQ